LSGPFRLLLAAAAIAVFVVASIDLLSSSTSSVRVSRQFQSIFEDDNLLVYQPASPNGDAVVKKTLKTIKALGANRVRVIVQWSYIAPSPKPTGFIAANPATYSPCAWVAYDRIDRLARAAGLSVYFDVTAPGPAWAMTAGGPTAFASHYGPQEADVEQFLLALGERYNGRYTPTASCPGAGLNDSTPLPRVSFWSLWNEPNQPGWLAPQYTDSGHPIAPALYRAYVTAFWDAMNATGHTPKTDTLLIGEMASEGCTPGKVCLFAGGPTEAPIPPITFLQALYCVRPNYQPLTGTAAYLVGCPKSGNRETFVKDNPGLFEISGFAHHPYDFSVPPGVSVPETTYAPLADLGRFEGALDAVFSTYGVDRKLPIYLTEYGYVTDPPNPDFSGVTPALQAAYIDQAQYMAYLDPRVRSLAQFELQDAPPNAAFSPSSPRYWETFQTGLKFLGGKPKPSLAAYRLPIFVPQSTAGANGTVTVWGMARPAPTGSNTTVQIQWRSATGPYEPIANVTTKDRFILDSVEIPRSGFVRIEWHGYFSRASPVTRN
jgi:hypothetical protein